MIRSTTTDHDDAPPRPRQVALRVLALVALLAAWSAVCDGGLWTHRAVVGPLSIARALASALADGTLAADLLATGARALAGVALGAALGIPLGLGSARARRGHGDAIEQGLDFLRAIPPLLVLPLALLALGYGESARVAVIAWSSALVCSLHVAASSRGESGRERALRAMGATTAQRLRWVVLPELVPAALTALRQACSLGLVVTVVTEMVMGAEHGLGARAVAAQIAYDTPDLYGVIACAGAIGWLASRALLALELRAGAWRAR